VSRHLCLARGWGDGEVYVEALDWPSATSRQAGLAATWVQRAGFDAAAALAYEPLDPRGTLDAASRERWVALLNELTMDVSFSSELEPDLRRRLMRESSTYAAVTRAMRAPKGQLGGRFLEALESVAESGVMGDVMFFE
jgi:hypothetical protein